MEITEDDSLLELSTISSTEKELLVAMGVTKVAQLKKYTPESLSEDLADINAKLGFLPFLITPKKIRSWLPEQFFLMEPQADILEETETLSLEKEIGFAPLAHTVSLSTLQEAEIDTDLIPLVEEVTEGDFAIYCTKENRPKSKDLDKSIDQILGKLKSEG